MQVKEKISSLQMIYLLVNVVGATAMVFLPSLVAAVAGRDTWLTPVLATIPGIYVVYVIAALGRLFPAQTLVQYSETILGPWLGRLLGFLYVVFFLHVNGLILREFGELMSSTILPRTPQVALVSLMASLCAFAIYEGIEVLARVMELSYPLMLVLFSFLLVLVAGHMDGTNLLPFLEHGWKPVLLGSLDPVAWRCEVFLLGMLFPYLAKRELARRDGVIAVIAIGFIITVDTLASTAVFGPTTGRLTYPTFEMVRMAGLGTFLSRLDAIWMIIWIVSIFGKVGLFHFATVVGAANLLKLEDYRPLVVPLSILLVALALGQFDNVAEMTSWIVGPWIPYAYTFEIIIPTLLLAVARFKKGK